MWHRLYFFWMLIWTTAGAPQISICPEKCECSITEEGLNARCTTLEFLSKLVPKQIQQIVELNLSESSLKKIDSKLKKLRNLKKLDLSKNDIEDIDSFPSLPHLTHLDLSRNRIENITANDLPKSIVHLDLSSNRIENITDITQFLPKLAELNLKDNLLSCECDFLKYRDLLHNVYLVRPVNCYTPDYMRGVSLFSAYCSFGKVTYDDWEQMLRDDIGSGEDSSAINAVSRSADVVDFDKLENNEMTLDKIEDDYFQSNSDSSSNETDEDSFEGSGSTLYDLAGSGYGEIPISPDPNVSHCYYNCSTPAPVDTNNSAPPANIGTELTRFLNELTGKTEEPSTTTSTTIAPTIKEEIQKSAATGVLQAIPKQTSHQETGSIKSDSSAAETPKQFPTTENKKEGNKTTYIVVGVLFAAMIILIAYVVVKKRSKRNNNRGHVSNDIKEPPPPVEMKPLMSANISTKPVNVTEITPLMNGQNGTKKSEDIEPDEEDTVDSKPPIENGIDIPEQDDTQLRPKKEDEPLVTPGTKRVTIQAKELSSPKSPILVHRHLGDDGTIIITPPVSNNEKYT